MLSLWQKLKNGDYPILMLEWRRAQRWKARQGVVIWILSALWVLGMLGLLNGLIEPPGRHGFQYSGVVAFSLVILWILRYASAGLVVPGYTSRWISYQRETRTLEMLALTPMSSRFILGQLVGAGFAQALVATVVAVPAVIASWMMSPQNKTELFPVSIMVFGLGGELFYWSVVAFSASMGALGSCLCSRSQNAHSITILLLLFVFPGLIGWFVNKLTSGFQPAYQPAPAWVILVLVVITLLGLAALFFHLAVIRLDSIRRSAGGLKC